MATLLNSSGNEIQRVSTSSGELAQLDMQGPAREPSWDEELARIAPESPHLTSLRLFWVPGDPWCPCERWMIYQLYPKGVIPSLIDKADLEGPDPRDPKYGAGYYDKVLKRFVRTRHITIDRMQWQIYQETGRYGFPYWVVQGTRGGHLRRFTHVQAALSKMEGGWTEPPPPGDLPYLAPNQLTWEGLREMDSLSSYEGLIAFHLRTPEMIQGEEREKAERMRARMWNQIRNQQESYWNDEVGAIRDIREMLPHGQGRDHGARTDYEEIERRFIQDD